ncbi:RagB/SusD family nutrient uptake outer membrane protein [Pedobacter polaris]|uniref:RagB/SusD family nutrient uptake outer membrane protein n=1 Tax=Pedobacter polaris TaxID=2571273 RepID=A0A4U1CWV3_9SPHI|nr:RagB/SusD family nutrient uptake outer membrane protein [Pedobacter polaris]TKC12815.1 RagB/SusD family nutrient uptake outer membrane protein [Pedobacter polaris]
MKKKLYILFAVLITSFTACQKLDVPPVNIIQDKDIFGTEAGISAYMSRIYITMPIEDFKYHPAGGFNQNAQVGSAAAVTGEASSRDTGNATETFNYWSAAYTLIRDCNYFMETLPAYASNYKPEQIKNWIAEARFIRAFTYFALVKRYGGVPIVDKLLTSPGQTISELASEIEELRIPRAAEEAVYDFIATDCDQAFADLPETNKMGRANKYAAAALKSRAMLFAGTIAKYNTINLTSGNVRLCGIPSSKATTYFQAAYDAANLLTGKYSLYKNKWVAGDKAAQYNNFVNLFTDQTASNTEAIFVRQYKFPDAVHSYDALSVPKQLEGPQGNYSSEVLPTLNFVEMFEGFPKNPDGTIQVLDGTGKYIMFNNTTDLFANAEPRLRATVILPGDAFKGIPIEVRRGVYTGSSAGGLSKILPANSTAAYPATVLGSATVAANLDATNLVTISNGSKITRAGQSGVFTAIGVNATGGTFTGFYVRKYLNPDKATAETIPGRSEQQWMELRYGEVLLNKAEAAYELGGTYATEALTIINQIRDRAGATPYVAINTANDIRMERRRELAFENKTIWDMKRWRIADAEQSNTIYRALLPIMVADQSKYIMDSRFEERSVQFTFQVRWYYQQIPTAAIAKSLNLVQNPGW